MKYLLLFIVGISSSCNFADEAKENYMSQCNRYIVKYFDSHKLEHVTLTNELKSSICECGFKSVENDYRTNGGEINNDKMYWVPLEECIENSLK